jgi:nickel-dependent lactate racemase
MLLINRGSDKEQINTKELEAILIEAFDKFKDRERILIIPPDITRYHSKAGLITSIAWKYFGDRIKTILPALGTHVPMAEEEIDKMYPGVPHRLFKVHDWRNDVITVGEVPSEFIREVSEGQLSFNWPAQVNRLLIEGNFDLILSVGQIVPHEVAGVANYNKNIFVGVGGKEGINKSHYLGAVYGMERMMGRIDTPVRKVLNYAQEKFIKSLPLFFIHTVMAKDTDGSIAMRGLYMGDDEECFVNAANLSIKVNFQLMDKPLKKVVVYLEPEEYKSTWLGNKSIYRTRMVIDDGGELIVLAPGLKEFGEDKKINELILKYGYRPSVEVVALTNENEDLQNNLSAAAHLIHGSPEGRFNVTYCPGKLSKKEIESVGFKYGELEPMMNRYNPTKLKDGFNTIDGEEIFYISNPGLGLWAFKDRLIK